VDTAASCHLPLQRRRGVQLARCPRLHHLGRSSAIRDARYFVFWQKTGKKIQILTQKGRQRATRSKASKLSILFTCFTGRQRATRSKASKLSILFTCFTGRQRATRSCSTTPGRKACAASSASRYSVYLLYWYKSTNTDRLPRLEAIGSGGRAMLTRTTQGAGLFSFFYQRSVALPLVYEALSY
jgi:hypothetical protein